MFQTLTTHCIFKLGYENKEKLLTSSFTSLLLLKQYKDQTSM